MKNLTKKPFLILQLRPEDVASENEFDAFLSAGDLKNTDVHRIRMDKVGVPKLNLELYSGIIIGGGPANVSDPFDKKPLYQKKLENDLSGLLEQILDRDIPCLGACYGLGAIANFAGGEVSKERYGEAVGSVEIRLTDEGKADPLLTGLPESFNAFVGHKEAVQDVPKDGVLLGSSPTCPVQILRIKKNIYGTQFHPELDNDGLTLRIQIYKHAGYFPPEDAENLIDKARKQSVFVPEQIFRKFIQLYSL
jgi:GMP synthase (glutamine-hydrolysing)